MRHILHVIDAFTNRPFAGNPAAVCVLDGPADETWMQLVAREMNLAETAFVHAIEDGWSLRWFTPDVEVDLCGHATLAAAHLLWELQKLPRNVAARFFTRSGWLECSCENDWITMDFPASSLKDEQDARLSLESALGAPLVSVMRTDFDLLCEIASEADLRALKPDWSRLTALSSRGVCVTCRSEAPEFDFFSRFFAPAVGVNEDPVTGSAHCALGPYWQMKLGKDELVAFQTSKRGGVVKMSVREDRVLLRGQAVFMSRIELAGAASGAESAHHETWRRT